MRTAARTARTGARPNREQTVLALDYPPNAHNVPRYVSPHTLLDERIRADEDQYGRTLATISAYAPDLARIAIRESDGKQPAWINGFLPGLDSAALYAFLRSWAPARYVEVGSGNSTKLAARAKADGELHTSIISIDPSPRASINELCDEIIREPLESTAPEIWQRVQPGDIVFMDGSHRVFMNGDVVAFFLDALPSLPAGVLVGVHDIYLPYDYPGDIAGRYYSEQYVLAAWLLGGANVEIILPAHYVWTRMRNAVEDLWRLSPRFAEIEPHGAAFWFQTL